MDKKRQRPAGPSFSGKIWASHAVQTSGGVAVFDVYPVADHRASSSGNLSAFIDAELTLPEVRCGEILADVCGTTSDSVSGSVGFKFLEAFFAAVGAQTIFSKLAQRFGGSRSSALRFRFSKAVRDSVDVFAFERVLRKHKCEIDDLLMKEGFRYYVAIGVHRSDALAFKVLDSKSGEIDLSADVKGLVDGDFELKTAKDFELIIKSNKPLAYGVELSELIYNERRTRLELAITKHYVQTLATPTGDLPGSARSMIGGPEDIMTLDIDQGS